MLIANNNFLAEQTKWHKELPWVFKANNESFAKRNEIHQTPIK
jgi:hypothetical protein